MNKKPARLTVKLMVLLFACILLELWVALDLPCPFRYMTGLPCPGCGMSRAWLAFFQLDWKQAFRSHPMFWCVPIVALLALYDFQLFTSPRRNTALLCAIALGVVICYALRLIAFLNGSGSL